MNTEDTKSEMRERFFHVMKKGDMEGRKPHYQAIFAHRGEVANREREAFFDEAYAEILLDLFLRWTQTNLHETDLRESLFHNVLALGSVKGKLAEYDMYARNAPFLMENNDEDNEDGTN
jgi:hypothetical protein